MIEGNPDGKLDEHGDGAAGRAHPRLFIQLHLLLSQSLLILGILFLELSHLGLECLHGSAGTKLFQGEGEKTGSSNNGYHDNRQSEVVKQMAGQPYQAVQH